MTSISDKVFERFFKDHYRPLCLFVLHIVPSLDDAEDIVQQTLSDIWERCLRGEKIHQLKPYVYQSVRNNALSYLSKEKLFINDSIEEQPDFADLSLEEQIFCSERDARLWKAIDNLPPVRRKILLLSKRDGLKYQQIADELNISVKTVENQIGKALKTLRETAIHIYQYIFNWLLA